jgi:hypothetical protein
MSQMCDRIRHFIKTLWILENFVFIFNDSETTGIMKKT